MLGEVEEARALGLEPRPVLLGPVSFLMLARLDPGCVHEHGTLALLDTVLDAYAGLLMLLHQEHVDLVQLDEPCLVGPLTDLQRAAFRDSFARLSRLTSGPELVLTTYFGALAENLPLAVASGFGALHIDLVRAPEQLEPVLTALPASMRLSVGVIDGSAAQRSDLAQAHALVRRATERLGSARVWVAPSCSLLHVPSAQAAAKLAELRSLADIANRARSS